MGEVAFHKYHALGNDYLVIDPRTAALALTPHRIRALCDRQRGIGADGIISGPAAGADERGDMHIRIFNPDGSEAEKSGNGIRIFARYALEAGYVTAGEPFGLKTRGGVVSVRIFDERGALIEVDMGHPSFRSGDLPMLGPEREVVNEPLEIAGEMPAPRVTCVSMGNPHCVIFTDEVTPEHARRIGPLVENAACFPQRTNVQLARVLSRDQVEITIWERGAGYTLASGSSSCAAAAAARRLGLVDDEVTVLMPGGALSVRFTGEGHAVLTGPVSGVAHGTLHPDLTS